MARRISKQTSDDLRRWSGNRVYVTPEGLAHLERKLARLKEALPELISESARTAAYGDRSENAEYKDAKGRLRRTYRQIYAIEDQLKRVELIAPGSGASGKIRLGSNVVVESAGGVRKTFRILGPQESDPAKGRISHQSPLGAALIDHAPGDVVKISTAAGTQEYRVIEVE